MLAVVAAIVLMGLAPLFANEFQLTIAIYVFINIIVVLGLSLLMGYAGQISLGHAALYGIGAYVSAILSTKLQLNPFLTVLIGAAFAGGVAYLVGLPALRLRGHYLAMATLGFGIIMTILFVELQPITGGPGGIINIPSFRIGGFSFETPARYFYLVFIVSLMAIWLSMNIVRSQKGRVLRALHENEIAASVLGVNIEKHKLFIFTLSGFYAGIGGALYAHYARFISPETFGLGFSILLVTMVVVGGTENLWSALLGAGLLTILSEYFRAYQDYNLVLYGLALVLIMIFAPRGLFTEALILAKRLVSWAGSSQS